MGIKNVLSAASEIGHKMKDNAESAINTTKENIQQNRELKNQDKLEKERKKLMPVFENDINDASFSMPSIIRIVDSDEEHDKSEICQGSIGFFTITNNERILTIYNSKFSSLKLNVYPSIKNSVYHVSPSDRNQYIDINDYFGYIEQQCVSELEYVANKLGASYCKITMISEETQKERANIAVEVARSKFFKAKANKSGESDNYSSIKVKSEHRSTGSNSPEIPILNWFKNNGDINSLIEMRMNRKNRVKTKTYEIKYRQLTGFSETEALAIDAILKGVKSSAKTNFSKQLNSEINKILKYEVEFEKSFF